MATLNQRIMQLMSNVSLLALDIFCLSFIYCVALYFRYEEGLSFFFNVEALFIIVITTLFHLYIIGGYDSSTNMLRIRFMSEYILTLLVNFLLSLVLIYFLAETEASRAIVATTLIIFPPLSLYYRRYFYMARRLALEERSLCILGVGKLASNFYTQLKNNNWPHALHFFDLNNERKGQNLLEDDPDSPVIQGDFLEIIREKKCNIDTIVITVESNDLPKDVLDWLISRQAFDIEVLTLDAFISKTWKVVNLSKISPYWVFDELFILNNSIAFERTKRLFDLVFASIGLMLLTPLFMITALSIKLTSRGPVFFKQQRIGKNQHPFVLYKFRSMHVREEQGSKYTLLKDKRVTLIGSLLRRTRIDELPQLWNVVCGHMSLIGPRAEWDELVEEYEHKIPHYHFRHLVKPGITGWAQVNYPYGMNEHDTMEKLKYDLYYVRHYSFLLDLTICLKTIYVVFGGKGR